MRHGPGRPSKRVQASSGADLGLQDDDEWGARDGDGVDSSPRSQATTGDQGGGGGGGGGISFIRRGLPAEAQRGRLYMGPAVLRHVCWGRWGRWGQWATGSSKCRET